MKLNNEEREILTAIKKNQQIFDSKHSSENEKNAAVESVQPLIMIFMALALASLEGESK